MVILLSWGFSVTQYSSEDMEHLVYGVHPKGRLASLQFGDESSPDPGELSESSLGEIARHPALTNELTDLRGAHLGRIHSLHESIPDRVQHRIRSRSGIDCEFKQSVSKLSSLLFPIGNADSSLGGQA